MNGSGPGTPVHIAHVLPWSNVAGTEIATLRLIQAAATRGYTAVALHPPSARAVRDLFCEAGVPVTPYLAATPRYRRPRAYLAESRRLAMQVCDLGAEAIHCADVVAAVHTSLAGLMAGVPVISHVRNRYPQFPWRLRPVLRLVDHFAFVSRETWRQFGCRVPSRRGSVLYDGIAIPASADAASTRASRAVLGAAPSTPLIGMVARVSRQKDLVTLAHAAARVLRTVPEVRFAVVGDFEAREHREYYEEIQTLLSGLGIQDRFRFTGHRDDVCSLLTAFDIFVLSTHWEGFPLVILEAMAAGLPVVATAVDGIPEIVRPHETGMLVPPADAPALAEALLGLLRDRRLSQRLGSAARAVVAAEFSTDLFADRLAALYERVLNPTLRQRARSAGRGASDRGP